MESRSIDKQKDQFNKELNFIASKPSYTLQDFKQKTVDGLIQTKKGIVSKFMNGNDQSEAQLNSQLKILNAMFDFELQNPEQIRSNSCLISTSQKRHRESV